jgi:hypothetical protein
MREKKHGYIKTVSLRGVKKKPDAPVEPPAPVQIPRDSAFEEEDQEYLHFDDLSEFASEVKKRTRPDLDAVKVEFLWKRIGGEKAKREILGKCVKPAPLVKFFVDVDFIIWLGADNVARFKPTSKQLEALVFHELGHIYASEGVKSLIGHDFEAFCSEVEQYGMWKSDLLAAGGSFKVQLDLFEQKQKEQT